MRRLTIALIAWLLFVPTALAQQESESDGPSMDRAEWAADVTALYAWIRDVHPDYTHATPAAEWDAAYETLINDTSDMSWPEFVGATSRFVALTADGHTNVYPIGVPTSDFEHRFPVTFYIFADGLYVTRAEPDARDIVGRRVTHLGGRAVEDVMPEIYQLTSGGSPMWGGSTGRATYFGCPATPQHMASRIMTGP